MKTLLLVLSVLLMTACAAGGGAGDAQKAIVAPTTPVDDGSGDVTQPSQPVQPTTPDQTQQPVVNTPPQTPAFVPGALYCYVNVDVYCTNGNLGQNVIKMSMSAIFTGGNGSIQVLSTTVQNNVFANDHAVCTNANQAGCKHASACVTAILGVGANMYNQTSCGNIVMQGTKTFSQQ